MLLRRGVFAGALYAGALFGASIAVAPDPSAAPTAGGSGGGGMTGWDGKIYSSPKPLGYDRVHFDQSQARPIEAAQEVIARVKEAKPGQAQQLYSDAENVVEQLKAEIAKLETKSSELQAKDRRAEMIRAEMAIAQMKAQIEEVDMAFIVVMLADQLH